MTSDRQLEEAMARLRTAAADLGAEAFVQEPTAAREALEASLRTTLDERTRPLAERLARLETQLDDLTTLLGARDRQLPADPEAIGERLRAEFARERAQRRRAVAWLVLLALLAGAAGWLWGEAVDLAGVLETVSERATALVETARAWLGGV